MLLLTLNKSKNLVVEVSILLAFKTSLGETGCLGNPYLLLYWLPKHPGFDSSPNIVRPPLVSYSSLYSTFVTSWCHATPLVTSYFPPNHLPQMLWIWKSVFYSQAFFTLHFLLLFQGFPGASSSTSQSAGLHADHRNIAPAQLFVWITAIKKRFIWGRFYLRVRAGQSQRISFVEH